MVAGGGEGVLGERVRQGERKLHPGLLNDTWIDILKLGDIVRYVSQKKLAAALSRKLPFNDTLEHFKAQSVQFKNWNSLNLM